MLVLTVKLNGGVEEKAVGQLRRDSMTDILVVYKKNFESVHDASPSTCYQSTRKIQ